MKKKIEKKMKKRFLTTIVFNKKPIESVKNLKECVLFNAD